MDRDRKRMSTCEWGSSSEGADSDLDDLVAGLRSSRWAGVGRYLLQDRGGVRGRELGLPPDTA